MKTIEGVTYFNNSFKISFKKNGDPTFCLDKIKKIKKKGKKKKSKGKGNLQAYNNDKHLGEKVGLL